MTYDDVIKFFGSQRKAAKAIGVADPSVYLWRTSTIPYVRQCQIEMITHGNLLASRKHDKRKYPNARPS